MKLISSKLNNFYNKKRDKIVKNYIKYKNCVYYKNQAILNDKGLTIEYLDQLKSDYSMINVKGENKTLTQKEMLKFCKKYMFKCVSIKKYKGKVPVDLHLTLENDNYPYNKKYFIVSDNRNFKRQRKSNMLLFKFRDDKYHLIESFGKEYVFIRKFKRLINTILFKLAFIVSLNIFLINLAIKSVDDRTILTDSDLSVFTIFILFVSFIYTFRMFAIFEYTNKKYFKIE